MDDVGIRVALLAKVGESRNQLRTALQDLGADLVCEGDPSELNPSSVSNLNPKVLVVSLEPSIEAALDEFDDLLSSSNIEVVYDDAEVSGQLSGWDLNRWARHLAAKIMGTDVMPPIPQPGAPETPAEAMADARLEDYLHGTQSLATDVPVNESYSDASQSDVHELQTEVEPETSLDVNLNDLEHAIRSNVVDDQHEPLPESKIEIENRAPAVDELELDEFDGFMSSEAAATAAAEIGNEFIAPEAPAIVEPSQAVTSIEEDDFISFDNSQAEIKDEISLGDDFGFDIDLSALENSEAAVAVEDHATLDFEENASTLADFEVSEQPVAFSKYQSDDAVEMSSNMDDDVAALAAQLDEFEKNDNRAVAQNMYFSNLQESTPNTARVQKTGSNNSGSEQVTKEMPKFDDSSFSLLDMDTGAEIPAHDAEKAAVARTVLKKNKFDHEAVEGEEQTEKPLSNIGAVLILAGMGGPDAARQLLKALPPDTLNVPVLLYQHLEAGKYDRFVAQLQKVSNLPVYLAVQGQTAESGQVAVIPVGVGLNLVASELFFGTADSQQELVAALPAKHSVVIVLSGAAYEAAGAAAHVQSQGGLALAQDPGNCFEPAAAKTLLQQGGKTAKIPALAAMVLEYFKQ